MTDRCGVVPLCLTFHRSPIEMRDADGHSECRLPVALHFVTAEIKIPSCDAVKLGEHAGRPHLTADALRLLCRCQLALVAEHINSRQPEAAILAHTVADGARLCAEEPFVHNVSGHKNVVFSAPFADIVRISRGKTFGDVVKKQVSDF